MHTRYDTIDVLHTKSDSNKESDVTPPLDGVEWGNYYISNHYKFRNTHNVLKETSYPLGVSKTIIWYLSLSISDKAADTVSLGSNQTSVWLHNTQKYDN